MHKKKKKWKKKKCVYLSFTLICTHQLSTLTGYVCAIYPWCKAYRPWHHLGLRNDLFRLEILLASLISSKRNRRKKEKKEKRIKENKKTRRKKRENCEKMDLAKEGFWCWQELNDRDGFCPFISPSRLFCNNIWCWLRILDWKGKNVYIEGRTKRQSRFLFGIFTWRGMKWFSYYFSI